VSKALNYQSRSIIKNESSTSETFENKEKEKKENRRKN